MEKYTTLTGHTIEFETPDEETRALLARLDAMLRDRAVSANDMVLAIYAPTNPVMDREFVPGRGVVTPRVLDNPIYRVMSDLLYRKRVVEESINVDEMAARATLTPNEVAKRLGVQPSAIRQAIAAGRLAAWMRDGVNYIDPASLEHFELAPRGRAPSDDVPRASAHALVIREGFDREFVLRTKLPAELQDSVTERADGSEVVSGKLAPWRRVLVRVAHRSKKTLRLFVIEPADKDNSITAGPFSVSGRFAITEKVNNTKRVDEEWDKRPAF